MKLYTLISIALGVFGGTYSALAALRTHFETMVKDAKEKADTYVQTISEFYSNNPSPTATQCAKDRRKRINLSWRIWQISNTVPACLFAIFVFFIAIWVLFDWNSICIQSDGEAVDRNKFPWNCFRIGLGVLVITDLLCFVGAGVSWCVCKFTSKVLREQNQTVIEQKTSDITIAK